MEYTQTHGFELKKFPMSHYDKKCKTAMI